MISLRESDKFSAADRGYTVIVETSAIINI